MNTPKKLIIHHTGGSDEAPLADTSHHTFEMVNADHKAKWDFKSSLGHYIGYHYFIAKDGSVTQGRADTDEGAHTRGQNLSSLGICLAGNFDVTKPTASQERALRELLTKKIGEYKLTAKDVVPHRAYAQKSCFGKLLLDTWASDLVKEEVKPTLPPVLQSTKDLNKLSLTVKGILGITAGLLAQHYGIVITGEDLQLFQDNIVVIVSTLVTIWGIIRKYKK